MISHTRADKRCLRAAATVVDMVVDGVGVVAVVGGVGCWLLRETLQRWKEDEDDVATKRLPC